MFFPMIPDVGIDTDLVVLMAQQDVSEKEAVETVEQRMRKELKSFSHDLLKANEAWFEWGKAHPEDIVKYRYWFKGAHMMEAQIIPSMGFDFAMMSLEHVKARFLMIKQEVLRLILEVPKAEPGGV